MGSAPDVQGGSSAKWKSGRRQTIAASPTGALVGRTDVLRPRACAGSWLATRHFPAPSEGQPGDSFVEDGGDSLGSGVQVENGRMYSASTGRPAGDPRTADPHRLTAFGSVALRLAAMNCPSPRCHRDLDLSHRMQMGADGCTPFLFACSIEVGGLDALAARVAFEATQARLLIRRGGRTDGLRALAMAARARRIRRQCTKRTGRKTDMPFSAPCVFASAEGWRLERNPIR